MGRISGKWSMMLRQGRLCVMIVFQNAASMQDGGVRQQCAILQLLQKGYVLAIVPLMWNRQPPLLGKQLTMG